MSVVEWLLVVASPFMFGAILYFLNEYKTQIDDKFKTAFLSLESIKDSHGELTRKHLDLIQNVKNQIVEIQVNQHLAQSKLYQKLSDDILSLTNHAIKIEAHAEREKELGQVVHLIGRDINELKGKVIIIDSTNQKMIKVMQILSNKIKE